MFWLWFRLRSRTVEYTFVSAQPKPMTKFSPISPGLIVCAFAPFVQHACIICDAAVYGVRSKRDARKTPFYGSEHAAPQRPAHGNGTGKKDSQRIRGANVAKLLLLFRQSSSFRLSAYPSRAHPLPLRIIASTGFSFISFSTSNEKFRI